MSIASDFESRYQNSKPLRGCSRIIVVSVIVLLFFVPSALAQPAVPDAAIIFVVDESRSLTGGDQSYQERFYNSVYFMKEALGQACRDSRCLVGVDRFSEQSISLVAPKDVSAWGEPDLSMLEARPVDRNERSNFPEALNVACTNLPDAEHKALVLVTDGVLRSEENPDFAPVSGSVSRTEFIQQINDVVDLCAANDVELFVFKVRSDPAEEDTQYQPEENQLWNDWAATSGGELVLASTPDDPDSVAQLLDAVALGTELPDDFKFSYTSDEMLFLGEIKNNTRAAEVTVVGLQPFQLVFDQIEGQASGATRSSVRRNQTKAVVELPTTDSWSARILNSDDSNPFIVHPLNSIPLGFHLELAYPQDKARVEAHGENVIKLAVFNDETGKPQLLGTSPITGTLSNSYGSPQTIEFLPIESEQSYQSAHLPDVFGTASSFTLRVPRQVVYGVTLDEIRVDFTVTDDPFIADWYLEPEVAEIQAGEAISIGIKVGNSQLLANVPRFQVMLENDLDGQIQRPSTEGIEHVHGEFKIPFRLPQIGEDSKTFKVWVRLNGDETVQGEKFPDKETPQGTERIILVKPVPPLEPAEIVTPSLEKSQQPDSNHEGLLVALWVVGSLVLVYLALCAIIYLFWWWYLRLADNPYERFIRSDQALADPWIRFTWFRRSYFQDAQDQINLRKPGDVSEISDDRSIGISKVIEYLAHKYSSNFRTDVRNMRSWDDNYQTIQEDIRPSSPHRSIYVAGASEAFNQAIETRLRTFRENPATKGPTPLDLYQDLITRGFEPILTSDPVT